nr:PE-PPE domain-containing protein [Gordonia sp. SID5947]
MVGIEQRYSGTGLDNELGTADDTEYADDPYQVIYADYPTTLWPLGAAGYDDSVAQGTAATRSAIATYQESCGPRPVVVAGYSQGARVAGDVLADLGRGGEVDGVLLDEDGNPVLDENGVPVTRVIDTTQISGELYADPRRDGTVDGEGIEVALIGVIPGLTMTGPRQGGFGSIPVTTVCADGDPICDLPDPLHDPIGAIDGLVGYFTKHNYYPYRMYLDPAEWPTTECEPGSTTTCIVPQDSAIVGVIRQGAEAIGVDGDQIPDFLAGRWTVDLPDGIALSNLQPLVRLVQERLPQLPDLGYGAYLPDLFVFQSIVDGIVNRAPDEVRAGVLALAASAKSIVLAPVNFVRFLAAQFSGPQMTVAAPTSSALGAGSTNESSAARQAAVLRAVATVDDVPAAQGGRSVSASADRDSSTASDGPASEGSSATSGTDGSTAGDATAGAGPDESTYTPPAASEPSSSTADSAGGDAGSATSEPDASETGPTGPTGPAGTGGAEPGSTNAGAGDTTPGDTGGGDDSGTGPAATASTGGGGTRGSESGDAGDGGE